MEALAAVCEELDLEEFVADADAAEGFVDGPERGDRGDDGDARDDAPHDAAGASGSWEACRDEVCSAEHTLGGGECSAEHTSAAVEARGERPVETSDPWSARYADALARMAETVLASGTAARTDRYQVSVHAELVGLGELVEMLGVNSRQRAHRVTQNRGFPDPVAELAMGPVWRREQIAGYVATWRGEHAEQAG